MMQDLLKLYDQQLRIDIEYPDMRKEILPNLVRFIRPASGMNYISYSRLDESELDAVIEEQIAFFAPLKQPFSWHVYAHDEPVSLQDRLLAHGFAPDDDPDAVMVLDLNEVPPGSSSGLPTAMPAAPGNGGAKPFDRRSLPNSP